MRMYDLIYAKKSGRLLEAEQIRWWIEGVTSGTVPDEQSAALLMAICWRGMSTEETLALTLAMLDSGERMDLSDVPGIKVDKHSTGGVGDKSTLILGPIVAACGVRCAMFSGRGLGHTGGTVDKYSAIPGLKVELDTHSFKQSLWATGFANSAQTKEICPADQKLYALRDVTATVESIPLITASIMSKKLAGGTDALLLDVKCGSGAFMKTLEEASALAASLVAVGKAHGLRVKALVTRMEEPLGYAIGNALEVMEAVEILKGQHGHTVLAQQSFRFAAEMLLLAEAAPDLRTAEAQVREVVDSGRAMEVFRAWTAHNGGDAQALDDFSRLPQPGKVLQVKADRSGRIQSIDSRALGLLAMHLGAGRSHRGEVLDLGVGLRLCATVGEWVEAGKDLLTIQAKGDLRVFPEEYEAVVKIGEKETNPGPWILGEVC